MDCHGIGKDEWKLLSVHKELLHHNFSSAFPILFSEIGFCVASCSYVIVTTGLLGSTVFIVLALGRFAPSGLIQ